MAASRLLQVASQDGCGTACGDDCPPPLRCQAISGAPAHEVELEQELDREQEIQFMQMPRDEG